MNPRFAPLFGHVTDWIFDLDNCLYPASTGLFDLIDERMGAYIERLLGCDLPEAKRVQKAHFHAHGTTLAGLMREHQVDPHHFLEDVHAIPLDRVTRDDRLADGLATACRAASSSSPMPMSPTPAECWKRSASANISASSTTSMPPNFAPSPIEHGYQLLLDRFGIDPACAAMIEDMAQNLRPAKKLGMTTVWVDNGSERGNHGHDPDYIDLTIADVGEWLEEMLGDDE